MLLLTNDNELEDLVADALSGIGGISHLTRDAGDALEIICGVHDLDLAIIDFEHGPHGMTLLSAISTLREDIPVIVITHDDEEHVEALAYTNGATACFSKQALTTQLVARDSRILRTESRNRPWPNKKDDNAKNESHCFSRTEQYPSRRSAAAECRRRRSGHSDHTDNNLRDGSAHLCAANIR